MNLSLITITVQFFVLGLITTFNNLLIPYLQQLFSLSYFQSMLVQFSFFTAYFVISPFGQVIVGRFGYRGSILLALSLSTLGALTFLFADYQQYYPFFLLAFFVVATGFALLQVAINPYVVQLGEAKSASSRLNLVQGINSLGTTVSPLILSTCFMHEGQLVIRPLILAMISVLFLLTLVSTQTLQSTQHLELKTAASSFHGGKKLFLSILAIFIYVGAEVSVGSFIIPYLQQDFFYTYEKASSIVALYWGLTMMGRFLGSALMKKIRPQNLLKLHTLMAFFLTGLLLTKFVPAVIPLVVLGLTHSIMFPTIFTSSLQQFPSEDAPKVSSYLCMAIVGGAIFPLLQGFLADSFGLRLSFLLCFFEYAYLIFFSWKLGRNS